MGRWVHTCSGTHLDVIVGTETIQLVEQLQHSPLHLSVTFLLTGKPLQVELCVWGGGHSEGR